MSSHQIGGHGKRADYPYCVMRPTVAERIHEARPEAWSPPAATPWRLRVAWPFIVVADLILGPHRRAIRTVIGAGEYVLSTHDYTVRHCSCHEPEATR